MVKSKCEIATSFLNYLITKQVKRLNIIFNIYKEHKMSNFKFYKQDKIVFSKG